MMKSPRHEPGASVLDRATQQLERSDCEDDDQDQGAQREAVGLDGIKLGRD